MRFLLLLIGALLLPGAAWADGEPSADGGHVLEQARAAFQAGRHERVVELLLPLARDVDANAQYLLAEALLMGDGQDQADAVPWLRRAAAKGHVDAAMKAAEVFHEGIGTHVDLELSFHYMNQASEAGLPRARLGVAMYLLAGEGVLQDEAEAYRRLEELVDVFPYAAFTLGGMQLLTAENSQDLEPGLILLDKATRGLMAEGDTVHAADAFMLMARFAPDHPLTRETERFLNEAVGPSKGGNGGKGL